MRKVFNLSIAVLLMLSIFSACSDDDDEKSIEVSSGQQLDQTVYADETTGNSGVTFTTAGAWSSSIVEKNVKASASTPVDWVSISPDRGSSAGEYTVSINLLPNSTGKKRQATIIINCNGDEIKINVTQDSVTEDGEVPGEITGDYDLGFIALLGNYDLVILDEVGNIKKTITTLDDSYDCSIANYNALTKEVYIHKYDYSDNISEVYSLNIEKPEETKVIATNIPSYDYMLVSADGRYFAYDIEGSGKNNDKVFRYSVAEQKETLLKESIKLDCMHSISKDGKFILFTTNEKDEDVDSLTVYLMENNADKYTFKIDDGCAYLSPNEDKILIQDKKSRLTLCNLDGSNREEIKADDSSIEIESLLWSADGKYIYFDNYKNSGSVYKIDIESKKTELLTDKFPIEYLFDSSISIKTAK